MKAKKNTEKDEILFVVRDPGWSLNPNRIRLVKPEDKE